MNLLCPNCQKLLTVPDQQAGQTIKCPLCNGPFTVPALPQAAANQALAPAASVASGKADLYSVAAETSSVSARRPADASWGDGSPEPAWAPSAEPTALAPSTGYEHTRILRLSPRVVPWIAPVCLVLLVVVLFLPWLGMYPGGIQVYSQSGWGTAFGGFWANPVWEKVAGFDSTSEKNQPGVSVPMIFYVLVLLVLGLPAAVVSVLLTVAAQTLPPVLQQLRPWRLAILGGIVLLSTVLLVLQLLVGFSLQNMAQSLATQQVDSELQRARTPEEKETVDLKRANYLSQFNLRPTSWLRLAVCCHLLVLAGLGLDFWLQRRGVRPLPRLDLLW